MLITAWVMEMVIHKSIKSRLLTIMGDLTLLLQTNNNKSPQIVVALAIKSQGQFLTTLNQETLKVITKGL